MKKEYNKGGRSEVGKGRVRQYIVSTRLDTEHNLCLRALVRKSGQRPAEIVRQLIRTGTVPERMRREHLDFMAQLKGIARNLNQIAKQANIAGFKAVVVSYTVIVSEIESFLNALRRDR